MSQLGRVAGVHTSTISTLILKGKMLSPKNMAAVADALQVPLGELLKWVTGEVVEPYIPPAGAERLTRRERHALDELILTMIDKTESGERHDDDHDGPEKTIDNPGHSGQTVKSRRNPAAGDRGRPDRGGWDLAARADLDEN